MRAFEEASARRSDVQDPLTMLSGLLDDARSPWGAHVAHVTKAIESLQTARGGRPAVLWSEDGDVEQQQQLRALIGKSVTTLCELIDSIGTLATLCQSDSHFLHRAAKSPIHDHLNRLGQHYTSIKTSLERHLPTLQHQIDNLLLIQQARLANSQLEESRKAIQQADTIKRLTVLAFIYIPIQTAAAIFSINVREFDTKPSIWMWAVLVVCLLVATISAAIWSRIICALQKTRKTWRRVIRGKHDDTGS